jgi:hypothetical protein
MQALEFQHLEAIRELLDAGVLQIDDPRLRRRLLIAARQRARLKVLRNRGAS